MKIALCAITEIPIGKVNVKDPRLDQVDKITKAKKRTYIQVELAGEDSMMDSDCIIVPKESLADLILKDLELVETRLSKELPPAEKEVLEIIKQSLEKEICISAAALTDAQKQLVSAYSFYTKRPVVVIDKGELEDKDVLLQRAVREGGYISFFTTGEKETRAWLIRAGINAWEAAGAIHSDIQRGFIRAEIISFDDFISCGGETAVKQAGKVRLEMKEYMMKDTDMANFRFNKS